ncbi:hypothetical protein ZHAS_00003454 [Anopheles sinensis]|uniref:Uncharacterized protein n=1 Tax=Anopheles sinensis TaxID=74873 RepID=A0A084VED6_ANOSI|nr:hypothetical protein ZHAS_00003454 [Anopheles sinensis]
MEVPTEPHRELVPSKCKFESHIPPHENRSLLAKDSSGEQIFFTVCRSTYGAATVIMCKLRSDNDCSTR